MSINKTAKQEALAKQKAQRRKARKQKKQSPVPMRDGVSASRVWLPKLGDTKNSSEKYGQWATMLDFMSDRFPFISRELHKQRMNEGLFGLFSDEQAGKVVQLIDNVNDNARVTAS